MGPLNPEAAAVAEELSYTYPSGRRGVERVGFRLVPGERLAVMGPNGSGKSTLVRLLSGELGPTAGSVRVLGMDPTRASPSERRRLGVAGDRPVHVDALPGRENALAFARAAGLPAGEARVRVDELMEAFGLTEAAAVPAEEYSLGMRRKLLLVEAFAHRPDVLILDEPTLGLDPPALDVLTRCVRRAAHEGAAAIVATNDVTTAPALADRVLFLHRGRVAADAPPDELLAPEERGATVDVTRAGPFDRPWDLPADPPATDVATTPERLVARLAGGPEAVPAFLKALLEAGTPVRRLEIREAHLGDAFRRLTGSEMSPPDDSGP